MRRGWMLGYSGCSYEEGTSDVFITTMNGVGCFSLTTTLGGGLEVFDVEDASQR